MPPKKSKSKKRSRGKAPPVQKGTNPVQQGPGPMPVETQAPMPPVQTQEEPGTSTSSTRPETMSQGTQTKNVNVLAAYIHCFRLGRPLPFIPPEKKN